MEKNIANKVRYLYGDKQGHYESFFLRANHPSESKAFWIRYTIFSPCQKPYEAVGELWAAFFDGHSNKHVALKDEFIISKCRFSKDRLDISINRAKLDENKLSGSISKGNDSISWDMEYQGDKSPLLLIPSYLYETSFPKAKTLVSVPLAKFNGHTIVNGHDIVISDWIGSQNHNWGAKHTDYYAWGQVAGFDNDMETFFEIGTAQIKLSSIWTPKMTVMVLRIGAREYSLNSIFQSLRALGEFGYFYWNFISEDDAIRIEGQIIAQKEDFVGFKYNNPPGGFKNCLNTKIASCKLNVLLKDRQKQFDLTTSSRAAFEILTDDPDHGINIVA